MNMNISMGKIWILVVALLFLNSYSQNPATEQTLTLNTIYTLKLSNTSSTQYQITLPPQLAKDQNLYITGYSPINDPYQEPVLKITAEGLSLQCESMANDMDQVCFVPYGKLRGGMKVSVEARCRISCDARLVAYLSQTVELDLNEQVQIQTQDSPVEKMFKIFVPADLDYNEIVLLYGYEGNNMKQGAQMYIKVSSTASFPSKDNHDQVRVVNWGLKSAAVLYKNGLKPGDSIYVLLAIGPHTSLTFQSRAITRGTAYIQLNQEYYDYLASTTGSRVYKLDLSNINPQVLQYPILIQFHEYSGSPKIEVSLDADFKTQQLLTSSISTSKARFSLAPEILKSPQFASKTVYIRVTSFWGASYMIYPVLMESSVDDVSDGATRYVEVRGNQNGVLVWRSEWGFDNETLGVELEVVSEGEVDGEVKAYACMAADAYSCKIAKDQDIGTLPDTYKPLQVLDGGNLLKIEYKVSDNCVRKSEIADSSQYGCTFMFVLKTRDHTKTGKYAVTVKQPTLLNFLQQGRSYPFTVQKQSYSHFCFFLPTLTSPTVGSVGSLTFFVNILDGNVQLLSSIDVITPALEDLPNAQIKRAINSVTYQGAELRQALYYLTVYGNQYSDFVVTVFVRRFKKDEGNRDYIGMNRDEKFQERTATTEIELLDSMAQSFLLEKGTTGIQFRFKTFANGPVTLIVTNLVGRVLTYYTRESNHSRLECVQNYCTFEAKAGDSFFIQVQGDAGTMRRFSIVYKQVKQCYRYPIGTPIYISLDPKDTQCLQFTIRPQYPLQLSSSLTKLQLLNKDTQIALQFQSNYTLVMTSNNYLLSAEDLKKYCPGSQQLECRLRVRFIAFGYGVEMEFVLQRVDGLVTLYDGVLQRMETQVAKDKGKYFRVPISFEENVEIFLFSDSSFDCILSAKLLTPLESAQPSNYPSATQTDSRIWRVASSDDSPAMTLLPISKNKLKMEGQRLGIKQGWLGITVFGVGEQSERAVFEIQVTQSQRILRIGQEHIGFLQPNEIISYQTYPSPLSLLSIRPLSAHKCFTLLSPQKKPLSSPSIYIEQPRTIPLTYYIQALPASSCMYQISLQDYEDSILQVVEGFPTRVVLQYRETVYLLYYHNWNQTFRVYQFVEAGASNVYVTPLNTSNNTKAIRDIVDNIRLNSFEYRGDLINNLEIEAKPTGPDYCYECFYLIAVRGSPSVQQQLVIVKDSTPLTIRQQTIIDSYLDPTETETFIYYGSPTAGFNLSIDVVYGQVTVTVRNFEGGPEGRVMRVQSVSNGMVVLPIVEMQGGGGFGTGMGGSPLSEFGDNKKFKIEVQATKKSLYHLQILKSFESFRISQGMASKITMPASGFISLQFDSLIEQGKLQLNVQSKMLINSIRPNVFYTAPGGNKRDEKEINFTSWVSGRVLVVSFNALRGHYSIKLNSMERVPFDIIALIPKAGLTELRQESAVVATHETIFEIYIEEDSYAIIEVYGCQGNMKVRGSTDLSRLQRASPAKNQISLPHQNIGGHFVITTPENTTGQYFIRVQNKQFSASIENEVSGITYYIKYRLHKNGEKNPYSYLDVESQSIVLLTSQHRENVTIKVGRIRATDQTVKIREIRYIFAIGTSADDVKDYMICQTDPDTKHLVYTVVKDDEGDTVQLNVSKLEVIKRIGSKNAYIGAFALVSIQHANGRVAEDFVFVFEPAYLGQLREDKVISVVGLFEIMVIISLCLGGAIIIYALVIHAIKIYRGYNSTNELVEEESENKIDYKAEQFEISQQKAAKAHEESAESH